MRNQLRTAFVISAIKSDLLQCLRLLHDPNLETESKADDLISTFMMSSLRSLFYALRTRLPSFLARSPTTQIEAMEVEQSGVKRKHEEMIQKEAALEKEESSEKGKIEEGPPPKVQKTEEEQTASTAKLPAHIEVPPISEPRDKSDTHQEVHTLERGHIFFFYRPRVELEHAKNVDDVQKTYLLIAPVRHSQLSRFELVLPISNRCLGQ